MEQTNFLSKFLLKLKNLLYEFNSTQLIRTSFLSLFFFLNLPFSSLYSQFQVIFQEGFETETCDHNIQISHECAFLNNCVTDWINTHGSAMNLFNNEFRSGSHAAFVFAQFNTTFPVGQYSEGYARNVSIQQGLTYRLTYFIKRTAKNPAIPLGINTSQWIATNIGINGTCGNFDNTYLVPPIPNSHQIVHTATHVLDQWVMNQVTFTAQGNFNQLWFRTKEDPDPANPGNVCSYLFVDDVTLELLPIDN